MSKLPIIALITLLTGCVATPSAMPKVTQSIQPPAIDSENLWLEVAPQDEPCNSNPTKRCLMVREVCYDNNGYRTLTGHWQVLPQPIIGYQKPPNQGNVLRVKRYTIPSTHHVPARYVLQAVVTTLELTR